MGVRVFGGTGISCVKPIVSLLSFPAVENVYVITA